MRNYKYVTKYATQEYWTTVVSLLKLLKGTMNCHIGQLYQKMSVWLL